MCLSIISIGVDVSLNPLFRVCDIDVKFHAGDIQVLCRVSFFLSSHIDRYWLIIVLL